MKVRLFAALREIAGSSWVDADVPDPADAADVLDALAAEYGDEFRRIARSGTVVVNGEPVDWDRSLTPGDEIALLPPVSGGENLVPRAGYGRGSRSMTVSFSRSDSGTWIPHSTFCEPDHRPARSSSPGKTTRVHGAQPIEA